LQAGGSSFIPKQYIDFSILSVSCKIKLLAALNTISLVFLRTDLVALNNNTEYQYSIRPNMLKNLQKTSVKRLRHSYSSTTGTLLSILILTVEFHTY
jgi:hypothetical protein